MDSLRNRKPLETVSDDITAITTSQSEEIGLAEKKSDEYKAFMKEHRSNLRYYIVLAHGLLNELRPILSDEQFEKLQENKSQSNGVGQLLDYVIEMPLDKQEQFFCALEKTGQKHVANFIRQKGHRAEGFSDEWPLLACNEELRSLDTNWKKLTELVDPRNGLVDEMFQAGCFSLREKEIIDDPLKGDTQRNEQLFFFLRHKSVADYYTFIECLIKTKQRHAVYFLSHTLAGDQLPLSDEQLKRLRVNYVQLKKNIDSTTDLLDHMLASGCLTDRQKEYIETTGSPSERNDRLLTIVGRGSQSDYNKFIECLEKSNQQHVCPWLSNDGVVAHIVAKTSGTEHLEQDEQHIVEELMKLLRKRSSDKKRQLLNTALQLISQFEENDIDIITVRTETSIGIFFKCKSYLGFQYLYQLYESEDLKLMMSTMFTSLLVTESSFKINCLTWDMSNLINCIHYAYSLRGLEILSNIYWMAYETQQGMTSQRADFDIAKFPYELIEIILLRTAMLLFDKLSKSTSRAEVYTIATLSSVSELWWVTFTRRKFIKTMLKRCFKKICSPFYRYPTPVVTNIGVDTDICVSSVAVYEDNLYVTLVGHQSLQVYQLLSPIIKIAEIKVPGMDDPRDCVAWIGVKRLCIADWASSCLWLINLLASDEPEKFNTPHCHPWSLSARCKRLVITQFEGSELTVLTDVSSPFKSIKLPSYMRARSALESRNDTFIVTHRNSLADHTQSDHHGVSEVDNNGRVIRKFDNHDLQLSNAWHAVLAYDKYILIADRYNERVVLLKPDLTLKRSLIPMLPGQPRRLCYDSRTGLLFIAFWDSTKVGVYSVSAGHVTQ